MYEHVSNRVNVNVFLFVTYESKSVSDFFILIVVHPKVMSVKPSRGMQDCTLQILKSCWVRWGWGWGGGGGGSCNVISVRKRCSEGIKDKRESYPEMTLPSSFHYTLYPLPLRETATESSSILRDGRGWRDFLSLFHSLYLTRTHTANVAVVLLLGEVKKEEDRRDGEEWEDERDALREKERERERDYSST